MGKAMNKMVIALALGGCAMSGAALAGMWLQGKRKPRFAQRVTAWMGLPLFPATQILKGRVSNT